MRAAENLGTNASATAKRKRRAMMHFMVDTVVIMSHR